MIHTTDVVCTSACDVSGFPALTIPWMTLPARRREGFQAQGVKAGGRQLPKRMHCQRLARREAHVRPNTWTQCQDSQPGGRTLARRKRTSDLASCVFWETRKKHNQLYFTKFLGYKASIRGVLFLTRIPLWEHDPREIARCGYASVTYQIHRERRINVQPCGAWRSREFGKGNNSHIMYDDASITT
jgi:hypothetical protein